MEDASKSEGVEISKQPVVEEEDERVQRLRDMVEALRQYRLHKEAGGEDGDDDASSGDAGSFEEEDDDEEKARKEALAVVQRENERARWLLRLSEGKVARTAVRLDSATLVRASLILRGSPSGLRAIELLPLDTLPPSSQREFLEALEGVPQLDELGLYRVVLDDDSVEALAGVLEKGGLPRLRILELGDCELTDAGTCRVLRALSSPALASRPLEQLLLFRNGITDESVDDLIRCTSSLPHLTELNVCWCGLTNAGATRLVAGTVGNPSHPLERLWIRCNLMVDWEAIPAMREAVEAARCEGKVRAWVDLVEEFHDDARSWAGNFGWEGPRYGLYRGDDEDEDEGEGEGVEEEEDVEGDWEGAGEGE